MAATCFFWTINCYDAKQVADVNAFGTIAFNISSFVEIRWWNVPIEQENLNLV